ncbi:hypothetical protein NDU88_004921, partial [Pleurodeles waltl]
GVSSSSKRFTALSSSPGSYSKALNAMEVCRGSFEVSAHRHCRFFHQSRSGNLRAPGAESAQAGAECGRAE